MRRRLTVVTLLCALLALVGVQHAPAADALPLTRAPRVLMIGDSLTWQSCSGTGQRVSADASDWLEARDGGCYGFAGATVADMAFMVQGGRFHAADSGQPHPYFGDRGMRNVYDLKEAITRADMLVVGLGTNESNRESGTCGQRTTTFWPVQHPNVRGSGPNPPSCRVPTDVFRQHIDYFMWLAGPGTPVFWIDVAVTDPSDPAFARQAAYNEVIWGAAGRHPALHPVPWSQTVAQHPEYLRDGVHLSDRGRTARHSLVRAAIAGCGYR